MRKFASDNLVPLVITLFLLGCRQKAVDRPKAPESNPRVSEAVSGNAVETPGGRTASAKNLNDSDKIETLITALTNLKDATFIRNGESHDVSEAIAHMRRKWEWKKDEIATVDDFIRVAASKSSTTGKPYRIRFADGREIDSAEWFRARLAEIESRKSGD